MAAYVQQHGGGDFTSPRLSRAYLAWCVPAAVSGRHPPMAVEDVLQVAALLPPSSSNVARCALVVASGRLPSLAVDVVPSCVVVTLSDPVYGCFDSG